MLGAIAGDIIGSRFENDGIKSKEFELFSRQSVFTDDTVHTIALADSLLHKIPYQDKLREYFHYYPNAGYGGRFRRWARSSQPKPYGITATAPLCVSVQWPGSTTIGIGF